MKKLTNTAKNNEQNPAKKIRRVYVIALLLIGLLTISSQFLVRDVLKKQSADSRVINIAGRQRMLSQKLTKTTLLLYQAENEQEFAKQYIDLGKIVDLWTKSHQGLQFGSSDLQIPENHNSKTIKEMFALLEPHFLAIKEAVAKLNKLNFQTPKNQFKENLAEIIKNEPDFLRIMNEITFQYDKEAGEKIENLKTIELALMLVTLLVLILEAVLIFRPAINKIDVYFNEVQESNIALLKSNIELGATQKELQSYIEELKSTEEEIRQNAEELVAINDNLVEQKQLIEQQKALIMLRNANITDSIKAAKRIQDGILVQSEIIISQFKDAFILNKPKDIVSGDFYWFSQYQNTKIMAVGDCTGHGVSGALMTMVGASILNEVVRENEIYLPDKILIEMDNKLRKILQPNQNGIISDGMELSVLVIKNQNISFAAAGNRLYLCRNREMIEIKGSSSPLGSFSYYKKKNYSTHTIDILEGDKFYIFSDGFKDQLQEESLKTYGSKRFRELLLKFSHFSMSLQREKIEQELVNWKGKLNQTDDVMVVGLQLS